MIPLQVKIESKNDESVSVKYLQYLSFLQNHKDTISTIDDLCDFLCETSVFNMKFVKINTYLRIFIKRSPHSPIHRS